MSILSRSPKALSRRLGTIRTMATVLHDPTPTPTPASSAAVRGKTMPTGFSARVADNETFLLPSQVTGSKGDRTLGKAIIDAWRRDGIIQLVMTEKQKALRDGAMAASRRFFAKPASEKAACIDSQTYAGYIASGEEITDGVADYSEIFTITKDLDLAEPRVRAKWPCHGPCPWPDIDMREPMLRYTDNLGLEGEKLLQLAELGLGVAPGSLTRYTQDGWHHTRVLRFPARDKTNGKGKEGRGIGSHTDYGLLVLSAQDEVGGMRLRPVFPLPSRLFRLLTMSQASSSARPARKRSLPTGRRARPGCTSTMTAGCTCRRRRTHTRSFSGT